MVRSFKYRIYPTESQRFLIEKHFGSSRFIYNLGLQTKQTAYVSCGIVVSCFDLINQLPDLKKECPWLKEINSQTLQTSLRNLDNSFTQFFKGKNDFPKFKKKSNSGSFCIPQNVIVKDDKLIIPKFKEGIPIVLHRKFKGKIKQATILKNPTGKYFVSILCDTGESIPEKLPVKSETTVGIDLGIKSYLVTSEGQEIDNPKFLRKSEHKLKYLQRKYSKYKGKRTRQKLSILHEKVANQRKDFLHKVSSELISNNQTIILENLNVFGMLKNSQLSKSISDASWSKFVNFLEYKGEWKGVNILRIGRFEPSSKTCSSCGFIYSSLKLHEREWECRCGAVHDRDVNAAINIKNFGLKSYLSAERRLKNQNELPTLVGVLTSEVSNLKDGSCT